MPQPFLTGLVLEFIRYPLPFLPLTSPSCLSLIPSLHLSPILVSLSPLPLLLIVLLSPQLKPPSIPLSQPPIPMIFESPRTSLRLLSSIQPPPFFSAFICPYFSFRPPVPHTTPTTLLLYSFRFFPSSPPPPSLSHPSLLTFARFLLPSFAPLILPPPSIPLP